MASNKTKTEKLSVRLLAEGEVVSEKTLKEMKHNEKSITPLKNGSFLVLPNPSSNPPGWIGTIKAILESQEGDKAKVEALTKKLTGLKNRSHSALLYFRITEDNRYMVIAWGTGYHKVNYSLDYRFALRTALNLVNPDQIKTLSATELDNHSTKTTTQKGKASPQVGFGITRYQSILKKIDAKIKDGWELKDGWKFSGDVSSSDAALSIKMPVDSLESIIDSCKNIYGISKGEEYIANGFGWIDDIQPIKDTKKKEELDDKLLEAMIKFRERGDASDKFNILMSPPEIIDYSEIDHFKFTHRAKGMGNEQYDELTFEDFIKGINPEKLKSLEKFKACKVKSFKDSNEEQGKEWAAYKCLTYEVVIGEKNDDSDTYILSDGEWYKVSRRLYSKVEATFDQAKKNFGKSGLEELPKIRLKPENDKGKVYSEDEGVYNERAAESCEFLFLDKKLLQTTTTPIEVCDLLSKDGHLIHVKRGTGASTLSHLFNQGVVSIQTLTADDQKEGRKKFYNANLKGKKNFSDILLDSDGSFNSQGKYVVYAIAPSGNTHIKDDEILSFFNLLSFHDACTSLTGRGITCCLTCISIDKTTPTDTKVKAEACDASPAIKVVT